MPWQIPGGWPVGAGGAVPEECVESVLTEWLAHFLLINEFEASGPSGTKGVSAAGIRGAAFQGGRSMIRIYGFLLTVVFTGSAFAQSPRPRTKDHEPWSLAVLGQTVGHQAAVPFPTSPKLKIPAPLGPTRRNLMRAVLRDMQGSVVVVEGEAPPPVLRATVRIGLFRLLWPNYSPAADLPGAISTESSAVISGGNTIALLNPIGWGY